VVVVLAGTNNFNCTAEQIAEGIMELVRVIREKQPDAYIVLPVNFLFYLDYYEILVNILFPGGIFIARASID
jgi:hypothetical protein